jgi:hypothetical protein
MVNAMPAGRLAAAAAVLIILTACDPHAPPSGSATTANCVDVGHRVVRWLDWSPDGAIVAALLGPDDTGTTPSTGMAIASSAYPSPAFAIHEMPGAINGPIAVTATGSVFWQRSIDRGVDLVETSPSGERSWRVDGMPLVALAISKTRLVGARVASVGQNADVVDQGEVVLEGSRVELRGTHQIRGLGAAWISADGGAVLYAAQPEPAGPISLSLAGPDNWTVIQSDLAIAPVAMNNELDRAIIRESSSSLIRSVDRSGARRAISGLDGQVLSFDVSIRDVVAYGTANFTGGAGRVCFANLDG